MQFETPSYFFALIILQGKKHATSVNSFINSNHSLECPFLNILQFLFPSFRKWLINSFFFLIYHTSIREFWQPTDIRIIQ